MKRTILFLMTLMLAATFNGAAATAQQPATTGDSTIRVYEEPITKTVVLDEEETEEGDMPPRNKWVTAGLVVFGIVGFLFLKSRRKKKPVKKEPDQK